MTVKVAVNGFGRIGRVFLRSVLKYHPEIDVVAINDLSDINTMAHLLKRDTVYGTLDEEVKVDGDALVVGDRRIAYLSIKDASYPWKEMGVDVVLESTGIFTERDKAARHLEAGARRVVISAPGKNEDAMLLMGVNENDYDPAQHYVVSNASCTTNCLAPVAKVLHDNFGLVRGLMNTIHSYTNDQVTQDGIHKDWRRARAASENIIPTTTGAAKAVGKVLPELDGRLNGFALRVPTPTGSVVDLTAELEKSVTAEEVVNALKEAAAGPMKGVLYVTDEELVSSDFIGNPYSSIVDAPMTMIMQEKMVKVLAWYDNEWAYCVRCGDLIKFMHSKGL